jgi:translation initiation factor 1 (eIF-1/SUI1)
MLLGGDAPGAEGDREKGEQQGHRQIERGRGRARREVCAIEGIDDHQYGRRDGFELERHIGRRSDQR